MNNSSISALYRNVLVILHIHLYCYFKASVTVAPGSVQQLNISRTTATCPSKPEDLINNVCLWQPNPHSHHAGEVWSWVHKSSWMCSLFNSDCWRFQDSPALQTSQRISRGYIPCSHAETFLRLPSPSQLWPQLLFPSLGVISPYYAKLKWLLFYSPPCVSLSIFTDQMSTCIE